ncbi:E3 SUMO-protein ligase pli1 [Coemansia sp. RSA 2322]|nr:E3 SUMO-protein ligase pli1 [Coemansia sp. RSA 2322]
MPHRRPAVTSAPAAAINNVAGNGFDSLSFSDSNFVLPDQNLMRPEVLPESAARQHAKSMTLVLTDDQIGMLTAPSSSDGSQESYGVYLFMCLYNEACMALNQTPRRPVRVCFPNQLAVTVNSSIAWPTRTHKHCVEPIDLTGMLNKTNTSHNSICVSYSTGSRWIAAFVLAKHHTTQSIIGEIRKGQYWAWERVRERFFSHSNADDDDELVSTGALVSLKCPLGLSRIKTPSRSTFCQHVQCFDCEIFIQLSRKLPVWKCPVCSIVIKSWRELIVDGYFEAILQGTSAADDQVYIEPNGDWRPKKDAPTPLKDSKSSTGRPLDVDDDDTIDLGNWSTNGYQSTSKNKRRRIEVVDLTLDSESEGDDGIDDLFDEAFPPMTQEDIELISSVEAAAMTPVTLSASTSASSTAISHSHSPSSSGGRQQQAPVPAKYSAGYLGQGYDKNDIFVHPSFISGEEHDLLVKCCETKLKRLASSYEMGHFDKRIHNYRECSVSSWLPLKRAVAGRVAEAMGRAVDSDPIDLPDRSSNGKSGGWTTVGKYDGQIRHILDRVWELFPASFAWLPPHILDLHENGEILSHVDNPDYSGFAVGGLCLLGPAVCTFKHVEDASVSVDVLLEPRSIYFMTNKIRYQFTHEITVDPKQRQWQGKAVPKARRISLMFRDAKTPEQGWESLAS